MKPETPFLIGIFAAAFLFVPAGHSAFCPTLGWAEGLNNYTNASHAFPTKDTAGNPSDCDFHQWSWEAFVWATAIDPKTLQARFQAMPSPDDLQLSTPFSALKGKKRTLTLKPRNLKPRGLQQTTNNIDLIEQASGGILADQTGQPIFYAVHMNQIYYQFVQRFYGPKAYAKASPTQNFPVGAAVFKSAWRIVPGPVNGYYTTEATVPILSNSTNGIVVSPTQTRNVTVALVGFHVVGVTEQHPEFLWGTFEHINNSPIIANPDNWNTALPVSGKDFTFYKANTIASNCNQQVTLTVADPKAQTLAPIPNVFLQYGYGGALSNRYTDITNVDGQARGAMKSMGGTEAVFQNYRLLGTVWLLPNSLVPGDSSLSDQAIACNELANSTMETYVQGPQSNSGTPANCFMCHNTGGYSSYKIPGKNINISHVILGPLFNAGTGTAGKAATKAKK